MKFVGPYTLEMNAEELIRFFDEHCEEDSFVYNNNDGRHVGAVTAITGDERLVVRVESVGADMYTESFRTVHVAASDKYEYTVTIPE